MQVSTHKLAANLSQEQGHSGTVCTRREFKQRQEAQGSMGSRIALISTTHRAVTKQQSF